MGDLYKIVVLSDGDTWESVNPAVSVLFLSWEGEGHMCDGGTVDTIEHKDIVHEVSLQELIDCWLANR